MDIEVAKVFAAAVALLPLMFVSLALGKVFSSWIDSVGRNPGAKGALFTVGILAAALTEAIALYALLVSFLILFS